MLSENPLHWGFTGRHVGGWVAVPRRWRIAAAGGRRSVCPGWRSVVAGSGTAGAARRSVAGRGPVAAALFFTLAHPLILPFDHRVKFFLLIIIQHGADFGNGAFAQRVDLLHLFIAGRG